MNTTINTNSNLTKKQKQENINQLVFQEYNNMMSEYYSNQTLYTIRAKKLRYCQAEVMETDNYFILRSYSTIVAFIDKRTDELYDVLRMVYGYTATSAQHIAKFRHDYSPAKWGCVLSYTYRDI